MTDRSTALSLLRRALGDNAASFRDGQWEAIDALVNLKLPRHIPTLPQPTYHSLWKACLRRRMAQIRHDDHVRSSVGIEPISDLIFSASTGEAGL
jgi:hypothetical protein